MVKSRRHAPFVFVCAMGAIALSSAACAAVFGFERLSVDESDAAPAETSTVDAGDTSPPFEAGPSCNDLGLPPKPTAVDAAAVGPADPIHFALKLLDFGIEQGQKAPGLNLDRVCSPTVALSSCVTKVSDLKFNDYGRDLDDKGTDNAGFGLISYLSYLGPAFRPVEINLRMSEGEFGIVLRLVNWNGTPDDDDVLVEVFPAIGIALDADAAVPVKGGKPGFVASDQWLRDRRFQNIVDASRMRSSGAYVTGGKLVAPFSTVTMPITVPSDPKPLDITVQGGFLVASIVQDGALWKLDKGVVAGRWRTADILAQVREIYIKDTLTLKNVYLCDPNLSLPVYASVKTEVCDGRDIRALSTDDNKALPCDSISAGIRFDSYGLDSPGTFADLPAIPLRCQKDGSVPVGDDCVPAAP